MYCPICGKFLYHNDFIKIIIARVDCQFCNFEGVVESQEFINKKIKKSIGEI